MCGLWLTPSGLSSSLNHTGLAGGRGHGLPGKALTLCSVPRIPALAAPTLMAPTGLSMKA